MTNRTLLFAALLCFGCSSGGGTEATSPTTTSTASEPGSNGSGKVTGNAPEFTLRSLDGKNVALSDHLGKKVILLDFWATTCAPCLREMPHMVELYEKYKGRDFIILGINGDGPDSSAQVPAEAHAKNITFPVLLDEESSVMALFTPKKDMPFWVLIDKSGNIVDKKHGYDTGDETKIAQAVEKLL